MNRVLLHPTTIKGKNIFGMPAKITFHPVPESLPPGWYWKGRDSMSLIKASHCKSSRRRITLLNEQGGLLEVFEHIGFLRFMGFGSLAIECHGWPPFDGGAEHYFQELAPHTCSSSYQSDCFKTVTQTVQSKDEKKEDWGLRIEPTTDRVLKLHISCDYPELGKFERKFELTPDSPELLDICGANTIGMPDKLRSLARIARWTRGKINWRKEVGDDEFKRLILLHRAQDLMGALSLLCDSDSLFVANVHSHCGGHRHDVPAVHQAAEILSCL